MQLGEIQWSIIISFLWESQYQFQFSRVTLSGLRELCISSVWRTTRVACYSNGSHFLSNLYSDFPCKICDKVVTISQFIRSSMLSCILSVCVRSRGERTVFGAVHKWHHQFWGVSWPPLPLVIIRYFLATPPHRAGNSRHNWFRDNIAYVGLLTIAEILFTAGNRQSSHLKWHYSFLL